MANDDVIVEDDLDSLGSNAQSTRHFDVFGRRTGVAGRVIVNGD
jgi:hypothetical protein